jgi:hypothetical protein
MGLIKKQVREEKQNMPLRLEVGVIEMLNKYADFLDGTKDYVVTAALKYVWQRDAEFQAHLQAQQLMNGVINGTPKPKKSAPTSPVPAAPATPATPQAKS